MQFKPAACLIFPVALVLNACSSISLPQLSQPEPTQAVAPPPPGNAAIAAPEVTLRQLVKEKKFDEAASLYAGNENTLGKDSKTSALLKTVAAQLNSRFEKRIANAARKLRANDANAIGEAEAIVQEYNQIKLLQQPVNQLRSVAQLTGQIEKTRNTLAAAEIQKAKPISQFNSLIREKKYNEATQLWLANPQELNQQNRQAAAGFKLMVAQANQPLATKADSLSKALRSFEQGEILANRITAAKTVLSDAENFNSELDQHPLLADRSLRSKPLASFAAVLGKAKANIEQNDQANQGPERKIRALLASNQLDEAEKIANSGNEQLRQAGKTADLLLKNLADALNRREESGLLASLNSLRPHMQGETPSSDWAKAKAAIADAENKVASYSQHTLLQTPALRSKAANNLKMALDSTRQAFNEKAESAFLRFNPANGTRFVDAYPVLLTVTELMQRSQPKLEQHFQTASADQIKTFRNSYLSEIPETTREKLDSMYVAAKAPKDRTGRPTFSGAWAALKEAKGEGIQVRAVHNFKPVFVHVRDNGNNNSFEVNVKNDTDFQLLNLSNDEASAHPDIKAANYVIYIGPLNARAERNVLSRNRGSSNYKAGERQVANPEWQIAKDAMEEAQRQEEEHRRMIDEQIAQSKKATKYSNDPYAGLAINMLKTSATGMTSGLTDARRLFQQTPRYKSEPIYRSYSYEDVSLEVRRSVSGSVTLKDPVLAASTQVPVNYTAKNSFRQINNVRDDDPNSGSIRSAADDESRIDRFARDSHELVLSELIESLAARGN